MIKKIKSNININVAAFDNMSQQIYNKVTFTWLCVNAHASQFLAHFVAVKWALLLSVYLTFRVAACRHHTILYPHQHFYAC